MKTLSRWIPILGGAIVGGVVALVIASGNSGTTTTVTTTTPSASTSAGAGGQPTSIIRTTGGMTINQIYKSASPGVVDIVVTSTAQNPGFGFFGGGSGQTQQAEGSGVVYNQNGDILTDEHVVANANSVKVNLQDGKQYSATVVGTDPSTDVAVIHVNAPSSALHPIPLANSSTAQVGDPVVAIGSPFSLPETTTAGIVSQTGRPIQAPNGYTIPGAIQTDAAINPGNSGGPLLNASAQVLGLNDQIMTNNTTASGEGSSSGVGFAIPSNTVRKVADELIAGKKVQHAYVGVDLISSSSGGAQVRAVSPGSPATSAGLQPGDVITAVNGQTVSTTDAFISAIDNFTPGQTVTLTVKRNGQSKQIKVTLGVRPANPNGG